MKSSRTGDDAAPRADYRYNAHQKDNVANQDPLNGTYAKGYPAVPAQRDLSLRTGVRWSGYGVSLFVSQQELQPHQDAAIRLAGELLDGLPVT
ncbi:MAG TPA: hypothetical protein VNO35_22490 [Steroidobacteraceae bacterium]|nr:hypothetical protein [Steroidobacteraceae bacterium]